MSVLKSKKDWSPTSKDTLLVFTDSDNIENIFSRLDIHRISGLDSIGFVGSNGIMLHDQLDILLAEQGVLDANTLLLSKLEHAFEWIDESLRSITDAIAYIAIDDSLPHLTRDRIKYEKGNSSNIDRISLFNFTIDLV